MLITSMGFTLDMHFCRGNLQSISFFGKAKSCQQMSSAALIKNCPHYKKMIAQNGHCLLNERGNCENKTVHFQFDQDQEIQQLNFSESKQFKQLLAAYSYVFLLNNYRYKRDIPTFAHYKPPLIYKDIPVLIQSFLL